MQKLVEEEQALLEFKNTQMVAKKSRQTLEQRYKMLLRQLSEIERQGTEDINRQQIRMNSQYAQFLLIIKPRPRPKLKRTFLKLRGTFKFRTNA